MELEVFLDKLENYKEKLDVNLIKKACLFAHNSHQGQIRQSLKPYITHPLSIANGLMNYSFDTHTVCAAILHDIIEDTKVSEEELKEKFGEDITSIVIGVTKLSKYSFSTAEEEKAENLRKFILAFIDDIRVLIIKIFDRLDNIRTLQYISKIEKRKRIARETLDIYVPLAKRLALNSLKDEMEDICFEVLEPDMRSVIVNKTIDLQKASTNYIEKAKNYIINQLNENNIKEFSIVSRVKAPYSIWRKMQKKRLTFEDITDIIGFRIVVKNVEDCYTSLGILHRNYKAIFSRFKDYISYPKYNNYQSLHTCVMLENSKKIEFQIRTSEMDFFAERGISSHWNYKDPTKTSYDVSQYSWLQDLSIILQSQDLPIEYIYEYSKMQLFADEVFVITPNDDIISLQKGSSALDFAYAIHSELGNQCKSTIINGIYKPLFTVLNNGDKVEVVIDKDQEPKIYWLSFVKTPIAKLSIKKYINKKYKKEIASQAYSLIAYAFQKEDLPFHVELLPKILEVLKIKSEQTLFDKILEGTIKSSTIINALYPERIINNRTKYDNVIKSDDFDVISCYMGECCNPVYKDQVVAVSFPSGIIEIHHKSCKNLLSHLESLNKFNVKWQEKNNYYYNVKISIVLKNIRGALLDVTGIMFNNDVSILDISSENDDILSNEYKKITANILVKDKQYLDDLILDLTKSSYVRDVKRLVGN